MENQGSNQKQRHDTVNLIIRTIDKKSHIARISTDRHPVSFNFNKKNQ